MLQSAPLTRPPLSLPYPSHLVLFPLPPFKNHIRLHQRKKFRMRSDTSCYKVSPSPWPFHSFRTRPTSYPSPFPPPQNHMRLRQQKKTKCETTPHVTKCPPRPAPSFLPYLTHFVLFPLPALQKLYQITPAKKLQNAKRRLMLQSGPLARPPKSFPTFDFVLSPLPALWTLKILSCRGAGKNMSA